MDKQVLISRLMALPTEIGLAETEVITAHANLLVAKANLQHKEDGLLLGVFENEGMVIDGKNESIRQAQIRSFTEAEREAVSACEDDLARAKYRLSKLQNELKSLQVVAQLLQGVA